MPLYTKKQIADKYLKSPSTVSKSIARGKLVPSGDYIDSDHPMNAATLKMWQSKMPKDGEDLEPKQKTRSRAKTKTKSKPKKSTKGRQYAKPVMEALPPPNVSEPEINPDNFGDYSLDSQKKRAEIHLKLEQRETARLKNQKLRGESIPTDQVRNVITMLGRSFQSSYKNSADQFLIDACHRLKASPEVESLLKGKLIKMVNESHKNAITEAKKSLRSIIEHNTVVQLNSDEDE